MLLYISLMFQLSLGSFLSPERKEQKTIFLFFSLVGKERKVRLLSLARESKIKESVPSKKLCSRNVEMTYKTRVAEQIFFDGCKVKLRKKCAFAAAEKHHGAEFSLKVFSFPKTASGFSAYSLPLFLFKKEGALLVLFLREKST